MGLRTEHHLWIAREAGGNSTNGGKTCRRLRWSAGSSSQGHWCPPGNGQRPLVHAAWLRRNQHGNRTAVPGVCGELCGYRLGPERARRRSRKQVEVQGFRHEARWSGRQVKQAGQAGQGQARGEDQDQDEDGASTEKCPPSQSVSITIRRSRECCPYRSCQQFQLSVTLTVYRVVVLVNKACSELSRRAESSRLSPPLLP